MKKSAMLKKTLAVLMLIAITLSLAACGGKKTSDSEKYTIGFNTWGAGSPTFDVMGDEIEYTLGVFDMAGSRVSDDHQADKELQNVQNFISAGVDGITLQVAADTQLPPAAEACAKAKIPFVLDIFVGLPEDRAAVTANNKYYVGAVSADLFQDGYLMGKAAAEDGNKTAVLIGGNIGDIHFEQRIAGFTKAFVEEGGGKILEIQRCTSPAEGPEKAKDLISAYPNAECVYAMVGDYTPGVITALDNQNLKNTPVYVSNAGLDVLDYIRSGRVAAGGGGNDLPAPIAVALLKNFLDGHPILDENGNPPDLIVTPFHVDKSNVEDYAKFLYSQDQGIHPFTKEILDSLVYSSNPNVTYKDFVNLVSSGLTLEAIKAAH